MAYEGKAGLDRLVEVARDKAHEVRRLIEIFEHNRDPYEDGWDSDLEDIESDAAALLDQIKAIRLETARLIDEGVI